MRSKERNGLVFTADERVPADFMDDLIEDMDEDDINYMVNKGETEFDVTKEWDMYIKMREDELEDMLMYEARGTIVEMDKRWRALVEKYLDGDEG
jgi:cysteinyl-tRNA synthetase